MGGPRFERRRRELNEKSNAFYTKILSNKTELKNFSDFLCGHAPITYYEETAKILNEIEVNITKHFDFSCSLLPALAKGRVTLVYLFGINSTQPGAASPEGRVAKQIYNISTPQGTTKEMLFNKTIDHFQEFQVNFNKSLYGVEIEFDMFQTSLA